MAIIKEIPVFDAKDNVTGCCPIFHPELWDGKQFDFSGYTFIKATTRSFMYMPLNMDSVMTKTQKAICDAKQNYEDRVLMLAEDVSPFKCNHYFLVKGPVPGFQEVKIEGTYLAKVFDGPFSMMGKWMKEIQEIGKKKNKTFTKFYTFYTTCPKCGNIYKHNYLVIFAK
jgi:hypothetical protein